ncbi:septal ring lytic transglycosylase RlpA family protein [Altererythrobacter arenosus]|uniref:Endolytic peptidoglycan transglycosylase RlpA n=1 Tax=Altererythrobacter arenosus TaxID=3032592 RepID=A0ABY8FS21_9SPHN|nr:septal ring lytic transglycosylase RlpA family protein [Altererythrobacter sp. CAU 1644]WFL76713.1 septal ring lytic transglycosylase RlpA family protein [Altererythrobacter sp. CAU 1644]
MAQRAFRSFALAAALLLSGTAGHSEDLVQPVPSGDSFDHSFAKFETLPIPAEPLAHAVDIDAIEPPIETANSTGIGSGIASYYGRKFHGRRTASGETFDMHGLTAAHRTLPFGSLVKVTNPRNGRSVVVRINDRGPFSYKRTIDLSRAAAEEIGLVARGHGTVELELISP